MADKKNGVNCSCDVNVNLSSHPARPQEFGIPPEAEGMTCGVLEFTELYEYATVIRVTNPTDNGLSIRLGDDIASDGSSLWDDGAVPLTAADSISVAISELNKYLADFNGGGGAANGFELPLGPVATEGDGSWAGGAVPLTDDTPVSEAVDRINEVLGKLVPAQPPAFPNGTLSVANSAGNSPRLASGVTDNASSTLSAGDAVTRIATATVNSNIFNDIGPGNTGTLTLTVNGSAAGQRALTGTGDNGNYSGLYIADQKDYPVSTPGFWRSIDAGVSGASAALGINSMAMSHSDAGNTNTVFFVRDGLTATPTITSVSVSEATAGTYAYSSSIPHYGTGGQLSINASYSNLAGETYYGGADPFAISGTNSIIQTATITYAGLGITLPIARQTTSATAIAQQTVDVNGSNVHNSGVIQGTARNVNGASAATNLSSKTVLVKRGSAGSRVDENSIPVTGLGSIPNGNNAVRVSLGSGDKPVGASSAWDSSAALAAHEAAVVGGVLKHDQTDYSNYLPAGPNLSSGRSGSQYFTLSFNRSATSAFKIAVNGTYAGIFVKLPGISDAQPNGDGWWDASKAYDGAGIPGEIGDTLAGCALGTPVTGNSGTFQITFGTASSTNATGNQILVRIKLNAGQSINSLSISN